MDKPVRKKTLAVVFGGPSQEHDVSVVTASQLMDAADNRAFDILPVYIDFENRFLTGPMLREISRFRPRPPGLQPISFHWGDSGPAYRIAEGAEQRVDCVLPVFHGPYGEDGRIQGYFETIGIPVTGFNSINSAIAMRKDATKALVRTEGVNVLPHVTVSGAMTDRSDAVNRIESELGYPAIVKPCHLGSSIGVGVANNREELLAAVEHVLALDSVALVEPRVNNLVEYNIALRNSNGSIRLSAIETPKSTTDLLDFKEKYLASDDGKSAGAKGDFLPSQGMLSLTRDINPPLPDALLNTVHQYARNAFRILGSRGAPRIDFLSDSQTGEVWFNEINPIPGSYGFFLWEAAAQPLLFPELIEHLANEAMQTSLKQFDDPVPYGARLLPR
ncbi:MAG: D-alanine--D-alanine ligase [Pseudomonadota bacterium]